VPLGKDTMDVRMAWAIDDVQDVYVSIRMYVIDGVATTGVAEGVWRAQQILWMAYSDDEWDWKRIAGRRVAEVTFRAEDEGHVPEATEYVYPLGEVVFVVFTDAVEGIEPVPIEDVLAELPWMTDLEAAWVAVHDNTPEGW